MHRSIFNPGDVSVKIVNIFSHPPPHQEALRSVEIADYVGWAAPFWQFLRIRATLLGREPLSSKYLAARGNEDAVTEFFPDHSSRTHFPPDGNPRTSKNGYMRPLVGCATSEKMFESADWVSGRKTLVAVARHGKGHVAYFGDSVVERDTVRLIRMLVESRGQTGVRSGVSPSDEWLLHESAGNRGYPRGFLK